MIRLMSDLIEIREDLWKAKRDNDADWITEANIVFNIRLGRARLKRTRPEVLRVISELGRIGGDLAQAGRIAQAETIKTAIEYLTAEEK